MLTYILWIVVIVGTVVIDQITKMVAAGGLKENSIVVIPDVLRFTYVENRGMAFGLLDDKRWIFITVSIIALSVLTVYLFYKKPTDKLLQYSICLIVGGGIGNMIDRIFNGFVIDFIDFCAIPNLWMWVFNAADAFVCIGAGLMILYLILDIIREYKSAKKTNE